MKSWNPVILYRPRDKEGLFYHAYAVSNFDVYEREGRYKTIIEAEINSRSLAESYEKIGVDPYKPFNRKVVKKEQGKFPWKKYFNYKPRTVKP